jgi:hypothetical protein
MPYHQYDAYEACKKNRNDRSAEKQRVKNIVFTGAHLSVVVFHYQKAGKAIVEKKYPVSGLPGWYISL